LHQDAVDGWIDVERVDARQQLSLASTECRPVSWQALTLLRT